jgi:D-glycero-alpha-D-manno-heptose-7-phosphate kinase
MSIVMCRAPFRISFFGGGSDYPEWYRHEGGAVLSTAIDKYIYISCRYLPPFLGTKHRVVWRYVEQVDSIAEILHPAVREGLRYLDFDDTLGIELHYQGDLPSRSGMGSSSTFVVALLQALARLRGIEADHQRLAEMAIELEQVRMKETVGSQDQVAAAFGGLNVIKFHQDGRFDVHPIRLGAQRERDLLANLMLFFPGRSRFSSDAAISVTQNLTKRSNSVRRMVAMVEEGVEILRRGDLLDFGLLLHEAWEMKRGLSDQVSSQEIDDLYDRARREGAVGGKLLGAGGTGFILLFVPRERQEAVMAALTPQCINVPFALDHEGASVIYHSNGHTPYQ